MFKLQFKLKLAFTRSISIFLKNKKIPVTYAQDYRDLTPLYEKSNLFVMHMQKAKYIRRSDRQKRVGESFVKFPMHWLLDHFLCVSLSLIMILKLKPCGATQSP